MTSDERRIVEAYLLASTLQEENGKCPKCYADVGRGFTHFDGCEAGRAYTALVKLLEVPGSEEDRQGLIYLATPYGHPDPEVRKERFLAACRLTSELMRQGHHVYSPIAHNHSIALFGLPTGWDFWGKYDSEFLRFCAKVWVVKMAGWEESAGVQAEIELARGLGKPMKFIEPLSSEAER